MVIYFYLLGAGYLCLRIWGVLVAVSLDKGILVYTMVAMPVVGDTYLMYTLAGQCGSYFCHSYQLAFWAFGGAFALYIVLGNIFSKHLR
jgi:hypothetical protein